LNYKISLQSIIISLLASFLFSSSDASIATESSIILFQLSPSSRPILHLGGLQDDSGVQPVSGIQIQPTSNLVLGGVLSPRNNNNDLSIYYHILIGYIPKWKLIKFSSNIIQVGMHRYRFGKIGDSRWFSFSVMESVHIGNLNLNLCWNKLFTQKWEKNTILISTKIKLIKDFYLQSGAVALISSFFTPDIDYSPFLIVSINL